MPQMEAQEVRERIEAFERMYYAHLGKAMARYPTISDEFPYFLKGCNRIIATLGSDGVIIVHEDASENSFCFYDRSHLRVYDLIVEVPSVGMTYPEDEEPESCKFAGPEWMMETGEYVRGDKEFGWKVVEIEPRSRLNILNEERARDLAESDIATFVNAHLMGIEKGPPEITRDRVIAELETAINEFERVLDREPAEEIIQIYLSTHRNRILLDPSAVNITPKVKLGSEYVPDFVIQAAGDEYVLVEIERPNLPLLTKEGRLRSELTHAQQQVKDWFDWIDRHGEYARSIMPGIIEPKGWVIMGRRSSILPQHKHILARESAESRRITTQTYDDLLDRAKQNLSNLRKLLELQT